MFLWAVVLAAIAGEFAANHLPIVATIFGTLSGVLAIKAFLMVLDSL